MKHPGVSLVRWHPRGWPWGSVPTGRGCVGARGRPGPLGAPGEGVSPVGRLEPPSPAVRPCPYSGSRNRGPSPPSEERASLTFPLLEIGWGQYLPSERPAQTVHSAQSPAQTRQGYALKRWIISKATDISYVLVLNSSLPRKEGVWGLGELIETL